MPVLASDGGHKLSTTDRINTRVGSDYRGSHIPHFGSSPLVKSSGGLPLIVGLPLVENSTHQVELAKEYHYFPARKSESAGTGKELTPLYAECVNMLEGLPDEEVDQYLQENLKIIPLFRNRCSQGSITVYTTTRGER